MELCSFLCSQGTFTYRTTHINTYSYTIQLKLKIQCQEIDSIHKLKSTLIFLVFNSKNEEKENGVRKLIATHSTPGKIKQL